MADWEEVIKTPPSHGMSVSVGERLSDKPQNGDQRLNNLGKLESYYEGEWIVKEI